MKKSLTYFKMTITALASWFIIVGFLTLLVKVSVDFVLFTWGIW
jgi:hypothetical protein